MLVGLVLFFIYKSLCELGPECSPGLENVSQLKERLQKYLHIIHQQYSYIGNMIQTYVLGRYELYPYQLNQPWLACHLLLY